MLPILVKNVKHIGSEYDGEYDQCEEYRYRRQEETTTIDEDAIAVVGKPIVKSPHLGEVDVGLWFETRVAAHGSPRSSLFVLRQWQITLRKKSSCCELKMSRSAEIVSNGVKRARYSFMMSVFFRLLHEVLRLVGCISRLFCWATLPGHTSPSVTSADQPAFPYTAFGNSIPQ